MGPHRGPQGGPYGAHRGPYGAHRGPYGPLWGPGPPMGPQGPLLGSLDEKPSAESGPGRKKAVPDGKRPGKKVRVGPWDPSSQLRGVFLAPGVVSNVDLDVPGPI